MRFLARTSWVVSVAVTLFLTAPVAAVVAVAVVCCDGEVKKKKKRGKNRKEKGTH